MLAKIRALDSIMGGGEPSFNGSPTLERVNQTLQEVGVFQRHSHVELPFQKRSDVFVAGLLDNLEKARQVIRIRSTLELFALLDSAKPCRGRVEVEILNHLQVQLFCEPGLRSQLFQSSRILLQERHTL